MTRNASAATAVWIIAFVVFALAAYADTGRIGPSLWIIGVGAGLLAGVLMARADIHGGR